MTFEDFLAEQTMTAADAVALLGLKDGWTKADVATAFRRAAIKNHPDRGGTTEKMQALNRAKALLDRTGNTVAAQKSWREKYEDDVKKYQAAWENVDKEVARMLKPDAFVGYFESIFNRRFTVKKEIEQRSHSRYRPENHIVTLTIQSDDKEVWGRVSFSVSLNDVVHPKASLGTARSFYPVGVHAALFSNRRVQKVMEKRYGSQQHVRDVYSDPTLSFPEARMKKAASPKSATKQFRKADAKRFIETNLGADPSNNGFWFVPFGDELFISLDRVVWHRQPYYIVKGHDRESGKSFPSRKHWKIPGMPANEHMMIPEDERHFDLIRKAVIAAEGKPAAQAKQIMAAMAKDIEALPES